MVYFFNKNNLEYIKTMNQTLIIKRKIRDLIKEYREIIKKIKYIEKSLNKEKEFPTESLHRIIKKRQKMLKKYNEFIKLKNKTDIQYVQKKLFNIIHLEIIASRLDELKLLKKNKTRITNQIFLLEKELQSINNNQKYQYWDFD
jgi:hypothetical protein